MNSFNIKSTQMTSFCILLFNFHLLFCLLISMAHFPLTCHGCHDQDRRALLDFKFSMSDPANRLASWQDSYQHQNCCSWHGVGCSYDTLRVNSISLRNTLDEDYVKGFYYSVEHNRFEADDDFDEFNPPNSSLIGKFSPSLFNISHLEYIDLSWNNFQGSQIPLQLSHLTKLSHLDLSHSYVGSSISTQFNNLSSLHYLDLSENHELQSSSIKWVRGLVNLKVLNLSDIDLSEATSSPEIFSEHMSHLFHLSDLDLSGCRISSTTFPNFQNLSYLSSLNMNSNHFNSEIPVQVANLTSLSTLEVTNCGLQDPVPYLPQLKELDVSDNPDLTRMFQHQWPKLQKLTISATNIPDYPVLNAMPMLVSLYAQRCSIQGSLPSWIYNLSRLQSLDLSSNYIGYIHSSLSNLKFLSILRLSHNDFQGPIPKSISNLKFLSILSLSNNDLQGSVPKSISNLKHLNILRLSNNNLQGSIPISIFNIKFLNILDLSNNKIGGAIPSSICKILSLRQLSLENNYITGTIPSCISKLRKLTVFSVYNNSMEGSVSLISLINDLDLTTIDLSSNRLTVVIDQNFSLYSKFKLEYLVLPSCNLTGLFPTFICELTRLYKLDLSYNHLTRVIPSCISKLKNLNKFDVSNNQLYGPLPHPLQPFYELSNNKLSREISIETGNRISRFEFINLAGNELSGSIPSSLCSKNSRSTLLSIDLSDNKFSGIIPNTLGYCRDLVSLNLGSNNLTGNVPNEIESLSYLQLQDNHLDGTLNFISKLQWLIVLNLANNHFQGNIPTTLFGPQHYLISVVSLRSNNFNGSIPDEFNNSDQLQILDLSHNKLSGHIPKQLGGNWRKLKPNSEILSDVYDVQLQMVINGIMVQYQKIYTYDSGLDLSWNMLDGSIPTDIGRLEGLRRLNLSHNNFSDNIPASIGDMSYLNSLDLSFNRLSGQIPPSLTSLDSLGVLNLSYNKLSSEIPRGTHFDTLGVDGWAFVGNALLCGEPTKKVCEVEEDNQDDDQEDASGVGFWGLFFVMLIKREKLWFPYWRFIDLVVAVIIRCNQNE